MAQSWQYKTLTLNKNAKGNWYVELLDGDGEPGTVVGHEIFRVMEGMGEAGWELVTTMTFPNDGRPNLIFKKQREKKDQ